MTVSVMIESESDFITVSINRRSISMKEELSIDDAEKLANAIDALVKLIRMDEIDKRGEFVPLE